MYVREKYIQQEGEKMKTSTKNFTLLAVLAAVNNLHAASAATLSGSDTTPPMQFHLLKSQKHVQDETGTQKVHVQDGNGTEKMPDQSANNTDKTPDQRGDDHNKNPDHKDTMLQDIVTALQQTTPDVPGTISKLQDAVSAITDTNSTQYTQLQDIITALKQTTPDVPGTISKINTILNASKAPEEATSGSGTSTAAPTDTTDRTTVVQS
jgi:cysteinyl-tRNA synthetase